MSTTRLNLHEAETNLSAHVDALKPGDRIISGARIALWPRCGLSRSDSMNPGPWGWARASRSSPDSFFDPLPAELLDPLEGR